MISFAHDAAKPASARLRREVDICGAGTAGGGAGLEPAAGGAQDDEPDRLEVPDEADGVSLRAWHHEARNQSERAREQSQRVVGLL